MGGGKNVDNSFYTLGGATMKGEALMGCLFIESCQFVFTSRFCQRGFVFPFSRRSDDYDGILLPGGDSGVTLPPPPFFTLSSPLLFPSSLPVRGGGINFEKPFWVVPVVETGKAAMVHTQKYFDQESYIKKCFPNHVTKKLGAFKYAGKKNI